LESSHLKTKEVEVAMAEPVLAADHASGALNVAAEAKKFPFDRIGNEETVLLISGFPRTADYGTT
jgi:hypothetical protein